DPPSRRRRAVLLRRGLPPAVPVQEPGWLLQPRVQGHDLPGRHRQAGPAAVPAERAGRGCRRLTSPAGAPTDPAEGLTSARRTFRIMGTVPAAFESRAHGRVGLHVMYLLLG